MTSASEFDTSSLGIDESLLVSTSLPLIHRDMSWLQFNERVLAEAKISSRNPLLERLKFLAITGSNLDEFFMIRFGSFLRSLSNTEEGHLSHLKKDILSNISKFVIHQMECFEQIASELEGNGIRIITRNLDDTPSGASSPSLTQEQDIGRTLFTDEITKHIQQITLTDFKSLAQLQHFDLVAIGMREGALKYSFRLDPACPWIFSKQVDQKQWIFLLDDLLMEHLPSYVQSPEAMNIRWFLMRVTHDVDLRFSFDELDSESIPDYVKTGLSRRKDGKPVRIQITGQLDHQLLKNLMSSHKLDIQQIFVSPYLLNVASLWGILHKLSTQDAYRHLSLPYYKPLTISSQQNLISTVENRDLFFHHPYDSFENYILLLQQACDDPSVISIDQTVYRSDLNSPLIEVLKKAAQTKKVRVIIELRARFDESNNLILAEEFRKAGIEVAFGFGKLKLHAKLALITRKKEEQETYITHLSTGNYKLSTSRVYTDIAIVTSHEKIGKDAKKFFSSVYNEEVPSGFEILLSAPTRLHKVLIQSIHKEKEAAIQGQKARIFAKVNALVDAEVIKALYEASQAGVQIDLLVRGACSLIPGVPSLSDKIRVFSLVDKYLEHSRMYYFENQNQIYLSSADWMPRNFYSRLEIAFPVLDERIFSYLRDTLIPTYLQDSVKLRELTPQGIWKQRAPSRRSQKSIRSQDVFESISSSNYSKTSLKDLYLCD